MSDSDPLSEASGSKELLAYCNMNKDKPWEEWLEFDSTFPKPGKQGLVGLLKLTTQKTGPDKCVFKLSQYMNYLVQHESTIMKGLNMITPYCPHFCKFLGSINCKVDPRCRKTGNPFDVSHNYGVEKEVLLCEFVDKSCKFYNYIRAVDRISENILYSVVKQVLMAIAIAQRKQKFTHYDLHSNNVMMRRCSKDAVFLYVLDEENQFCVPTFGHYPVIIDFGFSYIKSMDDGPLWPSMGHTDIGFTSSKFDWVADPKLFLITVSGEIKEKRGSKISKRFRRVVRNIFSILDVDWMSGWENTDGVSAADQVNEHLAEYNPGSQLFEDYDHHCIDIIQSLIILPLQEQDYTNIGMAYKSFLTEWIKIENEISSQFYHLYILKGLVDAARSVRAAYIHHSTRAQALQEFRINVLNRIDSIVKFCRPKSIEFEKLLCSLFVFSRCLEGLFYQFTATATKKQEKLYSQLPVESIEHIYGAVDANLTSGYVYTEKTTVFIMDSHNEVCDIYKIPKAELVTLNSLHHMAHGTYIYDLYKSS